jgi:hypothetical protein
VRVRRSIRWMERSIVVRSHGTSPWELPQSPSPGDRLAGGRGSIYRLLTRRGDEMTENVNRFCSP